MKFNNGVVLGTDAVWGMEKIVGTDFDDVTQGGIMWSLETPYLSFNLDGGAGVDTLSYRKGEGTAGSINLNLGSGTVVKYAGGAEVGRDKVSNFEHVIGSRQNNTLTGSSRDDFLEGDSGNDIIKAGAGNDHLRGGSGNDTLVGGARNDQLTGGDGNDTLNGGGGDYDDITGGNGNDYIVQNVSGSHNLIDGGAGDDTVDYSQSPVGITNWYTVNVETVIGSQHNDRFYPGHSYTNAHTVFFGMG